MALEPEERDELTQMRSDLAEFSARLTDMSDYEEETTGGNTLSRALRDAADQLDAARDELRYILQRS
ncbi:hypothetical protein [Hymenobacter sp. GOD-10R]|uniref:hypothetical protein n=1 Tax=Hymenobacter sp. GOD-10R TaxID=3093922 RepID=UPI002D799E3E|nr:hypothetical protein [Hymenobacter sp. GOD-10R]WRQ26708.1 hypothetical protein SD425_16670 [Hymenobacter sp. GOD-10R]